MKVDHSPEEKGKPEVPKVPRKTAAQLAEKVRQDSQKLGKPTRLDSLSALGLELAPEEIQAGLTEIAKESKFRDIKPVLAPDDTAYFFSETYLPEDRAKSLARIEQFQIRLVERLRADSEKLGRLNRVDSLPALGPGLTPEEIQVSLDEMAKNENYQDIKTVTAFTGTIYLYSDKYIAEDRAKTVARIREFQNKLVHKVRGDSNYLSELTRVDAVAAKVPDLTPEEIETSLAEIAGNKAFGDIQSLVAATGAVYLYSKLYVTENYARILALVEANDPCFTIAEMVREESKIYPRPTDIELFKQKVFKIDREELDTHIARTMERYPDIKRIDTSTGVIYLFSTLHLDETMANAMAQGLQSRRRSKDEL